MLIPRYRLDADGELLARASRTGPEAKVPSLIFGPCRSTSTPTLCPAASDAARTPWYTARWPCWVPWLMLSRATSIPAATSCGEPFRGV